MKKYLIALLFGMSFLSIQTASAATLIALNPNGLQTIDLVNNQVSATFSPGEPAQPLFFDLRLDADAMVSFAIGPANLSFFNASGPIPPTLTGEFTRLLSGGDNFFAIFSSGITTDQIDFSIVNIQAVPVPAALWLFGSALLGLLGVNRRKPQTFAA